MERIRKRIKEAIETATVLDKAKMVFKDNVDMSLRRIKPLVNDREARFIIENLKPSEVDEFRKWERCFNVYRNLMTTFGLGLSEFTSIANWTLALFVQWELLIQEENHYNSIIQGFHSKGDEQSLTTLLESLHHLTFKNAELLIEDDGFVRIDVSQKGDLYEKILASIDETKSRFAALKSLVIALEEYTEKMNCREMMPDTLAHSLRDIRTDYVLKISPRFSKKIYDERISKGERTSEDEKLCALFPYFDEVEPNPTYLKLWRQRIKTLADEE